jgi:phosphotransferase system enzyme I (PtsP)
MLDSLRRIVQEVSSAVDLQEALAILVQRIKQAMAVDVCTVYLKDNALSQYVLMATDGLNPQAVGSVRLALTEGLVGLVGERREPVNVDDAPSHPHYKYVHETEETQYHGFLGVPMVHHRAVMGVMVVRQRARRRFDEREEAFLLTAAAQLAGEIAHAQSSGGSVAFGRGPHKEWYVDGLPGAPGVVFGTAMVAYPSADLDAVPDRQVEDPEKEVAIFRAAVARSRAEIQGFIDQFAQPLGREDLALFEAYLLMLDSDSVVGKTIERIRAGSWASGALRETIREHAHVFDEMDDPYLRERASDVRDLGRRILMCLQSGERKTPPYPERTVLVGEEITATMLAEVPRERLAGVVSVKGSVSSHVAILANSFGIPAVVGVADLPVSRMDRLEVVLDGYRGRVFVSPSNAVRREYGRLAVEEAQLAADLAEIKLLPAVTPDQVHVPLFVNMGLISDLNSSLSSGAEGVGLYRTEFPFMVRDRFPGEEEQRAVYRQILQAFAPRPVVLRTLDIGGDKSLSYFPIKEENPFLGWRGIRVTLDHPEIFLAQLRGMLRASEGLDNLSILLPMVTSVGEVDEALRLIDCAHEELLAEGCNLARPRVGAMIEVPSTVFMVTAIAKRVDFFSIGTNDLTQYLLAVDRNNPRVAELYDTFHPAVMRVINSVVHEAHACGKPVSVCGEMGGDPAAAVALLAMGVDSLSMNASSLARVKWVIRHVARRDACEVLPQVLQAEDGRRARQLLDEFLGRQGLGTFVRPSKK